MVRSAERGSCSNAQHIKLSDGFVLDSAKHRWPMVACSFVCPRQAHGHRVHDDDANENDDFAVHVELRRLEHQLEKHDAARWGEEAGG